MMIDEEGDRSPLKILYLIASSIINHQKVTRHQRCQTQVRRQAAGWKPGLRAEAMGGQGMGDVRRY